MSPLEHEAMVRKALTHFLRNESARLIRMTWRLVGGNDALAKDVIQDACVRCIEEAHQLRDLDAFESWFYRILVNSAHNRHRRFRAFKQAKALFGQEPRSEQLPTDLPDHGLQRRIRDALWTLKRSQREAFILVRLERLSVRQSAAIMKISEQAVRNHLHRAEKALKHELADLSRTTNQGSTDHGES